MKSCPEVSVSGEWLKQEIDECVFNLKEISCVTWSKPGQVRFQDFWAQTLA